MTLALFDLAKLWRVRTKIQNSRGTICVCTTYSDQVRVDKAECLRRGIDHDSATVDLDIDPAQLPEEERNWIADHLIKNGYEFAAPTFDFKGICPPTTEGFLQAVRAFMSAAQGESSDAA